MTRPDEAERQIEELLDGLTTVPPDSWDQLERMPSVSPWRKLRLEFATGVHQGFSRWIAQSQKHFLDQLRVAIGRFDEGARLVSHLRTSFFPRTGPLRILDVGSGNGGVAIAFGNDPRNEVFAVDIVRNPQAVESFRTLSSPVRFVVGDSARLPFENNSMDVVLLIDVLEHLPEARTSAEEIHRILRPDGICIVQTPARFAHLLEPDPHYGIRGLLIFPNEIQRFVVDHVARRRTVASDGGAANAYDVEHTFWHAREIANLFPQPHTADVIYDHLGPPPPPRISYWLRHPDAIRRWLAYRLRHFFFGHILIFKAEPDEHSPRYDRL